MKKKMDFIHYLCESKGLDAETVQALRQLAKYYLKKKPPISKKSLCSSLFKELKLEPNAKFNLDLPRSFGLQDPVLKHMRDPFTKKIFVHPIAIRGDTEDESISLEHDSKQLELIPKQRQRPDITLENFIQKYLLEEYGLSAFQDE